MTSLTLSSLFIALGRKDYKAVHTQSIDAIKRDINDPLPYFALGVIAFEHQNFGKSLELFSKAVELDPKTAEYHIYLAKTLSTLGHQNEAKAQADIAVGFDGLDAHLLDTLGVIYSRAGFHNLAIPVFSRAVAAKPDVANFHFNMAASAQFMGDFETAEAAYKKTLALDPKFYRAWPSLISLKKQTPETHALDTLIACFETAEDDIDGRLQLGHAIAKTYEDLGHHKENMAWLIRGKHAKHNQFPYDRVQGRATFEAVKRSRPAPLKSKITDVPIFIVGLPRTGTTLVDRILSSHPEVSSAGELNIFAELIKQKTGTLSNFVMDAETFLKTDQLDLSDVGQSYLDSARKRAAPAKFIVDKMPLNVFYAGLIHRAIPNARIIALRRGAMDSCLSNFRQLFSTQQSYYNYTYDLDDTAWFYRQFEGLVAHWRQTLPADRFMEVRYEDIVFDQNNQTRRLLEFCDLDWDEACLNFHENKAPVSTASSVQVRQPLYSGSIGRWKKYGDTLNGLRAALGDLADE